MRKFIPLLFKITRWTTFAVALAMLGAAGWKLQADGLGPGNILLLSGSICLLVAVVVWSRRRHLLSYRVPK